MSKQKKELDKIFSEYIRRRDHGICFICGNKKRWQDQQNGHYISRHVISLRFDETNCHCCCLRCNVFLKGNLIEYRIKLVHKFGEMKVKKLESRRFEKIKITASEYTDLIKEYKEKMP